MLIEYRMTSGIAHFMLGAYEEAVADFRPIFERQGDLAEHSAYWLAASYGQLGKRAEAELALSSFLKRGRQVSFYPSPLWFQIYDRRWRPFKMQEDTDRFLDGLRKAGLKDAE